MERPVRTSTLVSLIRSNHRARARQYQLREYLAEREQLLESEQTARSEVERAGRMKAEFLATLSHELRTPSSAILGWTHLLRSSKDLSADAAKGLVVIERNARSQARIIEDLLDMSSIICGKARLDVQRVELRPVVEATIETVRPVAQAKEIRLDVDRFRQADASSSRRHGGLGLGLSIVKQLVELHGGTITARSLVPGHADPSEGSNLVSIPDARRTYQQKWFWST